MTDNTPRPSTPAPSEGDAALVARIEWLLKKYCINNSSATGTAAFVGRAINGTEWWQIVAALRRPSHTHRAEAMRETLERIANHKEIMSDVPHTVDGLQELARSALPVPASADGWQPKEGA